MEALIYYGFALGVLIIINFLQELRLRSLEKLANRIIVAASAAALEEAVKKSQKENK